MDMIWQHLGSCIVEGLVQSCSDETFNSDDCRVDACELNGMIWVFFNLQTWGGLMNMLLSQSEECYRCFKPWMKEILAEVLQRWLWMGFDGCIFFFLSHGAIKGTLKHWFLQFFGIEDLLKCTFEVPAVCWFGCQPALRSKLWDRKQLLLPSPDMYQKTPHWKATRIVLQWHNLRSGESILIRTRAHTSWHEKPWHQYHHMGFACMGVPQNGWLMMESPFQVDDFGVSLFQEISHMGVSQRLGCPNLNGDRLAWEWRISMGPWFFWTFTQKRSKRYWTCYFSGILLFYLLGFTLPSVLGVPNTHWTLWSDRNLPQHLGSWRLCTEACSWNSWSSEDPGLFCHTLMPHKISMGTSEILGNTEHQKKL